MTSTRFACPITAAFDEFLAAMRMAKESAQERALRDAAMIVATIATIEVPLATLEACPEIVELCLEIGEIGLQASLSDAGTMFRVWPTGEWPQRS